MRPTLVLALLLSACAPGVRTQPMEMPIHLRLQEPHVLTDRLYPIQRFSHAVNCWALIEADRAVRDVGAQEKRRIDQQIKEWDAELQLNEMQNQLDGLDEP